MPHIPPMNVAAPLTSHRNELSFNSYNSIMYVEAFNEISQALPKKNISIIYIIKIFRDFIDI